MNNLHQKLTQKCQYYNNWHQTKHHNKIHWGVFVVFTLLVFVTMSRWTPISFAADTVAPSTPTTLTATPVSSSQINLFWTASTDDVGVAGYKIYRCAGSACAPTTQIATSATNSYSNTGLTPSTAYAYAVSAYDAAGNESGKSSLASATTQTQLGNVYYVDDDAPNDTGNGSITNPKKYITSAIQLMNGGDTLIIKDGIYIGQNNMIGDYASPQVYPPSGLGPNQYTVIKAENIGGAIIDGEYQRTAFSTQNRIAKVNYVHIEGIHFRRGSCGVFNIRGDYNKVIRSGFEDGISPSSTNECEIASIAGGSSYSLVEDSWVWGRGRIGLYSSSIESGTNHIIFRRVVVRQDDSPPKWVSAGLLFYNADTNVCQNCVVIDSNTNPTSNNTGAFETVRYAANTSWLGSIALNNNHYYGFYPQDTRQITTVKNTVFWGGPATGWEIMVNSQGTLNADHTVSGFNQGGSIRGNGFRSSNSYPTTENVTNSISVNNSGYGFSEVDNIDTVNVFGNTYGACNNCTIINAKTTNPFTAAPGYSSPALKYLPRIEANSNLKGAATDGGDIGATILKKIGVSGTLYGEPGWDQTTNEDLWPYPDEDIWTPKLRAYNASGPGGNRGFAADGTGLYGGPITLTSYIWEYLGNPCPAEICGTKGSPTITITQPTTSSTYSTKDSTVNLSGTATDNIAVSKVTWSNSRGGMGTAQGTTTWSIPDIPLQLGSNTITVTAEDTDGNTGTDAIIVTYDSEPPSIPANLTATAISPSQVNLSWNASTDDVGVAGYKIYRCAGSACAPTTQIATSATNLYSDSGLAPSTVYTYAVSAYDAAGNESGKSASVSATTQEGSITPPSEALGTILLDDFSQGIRKNAANPPDDLFESYLGADSTQTYGVLNGQFWNKGGSTDFYWNFFPPPYFWPTGFAQNYVMSGTFNSSMNRLRFKFMCNKNLTRRSDGGGSFDVGTYVKQHGDNQSNYQGQHYYHTFNPNLYANRWAILELNNHPQHQVGTLGDPGNDPEWNNPTTGTPVHYMDGLTRFYFGNPNNIDLLNSTCYFDDFYFDTETGEPDDKVSSLIYTYSGSRYEVSWWTQSDVNLTYNVRYSVQSMRANGFAIGTDGGIVQNRGDGYANVIWSSPNMPEASTGMYIAIQSQGQIAFTEVYIPNFSGGSSGDTIAPSVPTGISATVVPSSQINLSWTSSGDDVGVTGYKIYRCAGSGCAPNTQIATSPINTYSNSGLTASTAYTYAVSAYDAAGNESLKSSSVSATTLAGFKPSDLNKDAKVNQQDFDIIKQDWNRTDKPVSDINQDGVVDSRDLGIMMSEWTR